MLPTSGLNVAIEPLRLDGSSFSQFLSQKKRTTELTESHTFDWKAFAAPLRTWRSIRTGCVWLNARTIPATPGEKERERERAQLPHGELAADWRDSRFCTLSNPRLPVLPLHLATSIARVIDVSADVRVALCLYAAWGTRFLSIVV